MEEKEKLYDRILTEGARWLHFLQSTKEILIIDDISLKDKTDLCFLQIAQIASVYNIDIYICAPWYRRFYLKYIKKFKFLKQPPYGEGFYIEPKKFMEELLLFFKQPESILDDLYNTYYGGK